MTMLSMEGFLLSFTPWAWAVMLLGVAAAYVVFGIAGFGTALVAGPVLIQFMPLSRIIPLLVLLDFVAALGNWLPSRREVNRREVWRRLPFMALGCMVGVTLLLKLQAQLLLLLMGLFLCAYALYSLAIKVRPAGLSPAWAIPAGSIGGVFGALFGSGGFLYALYLSGRLHSATQARATQSALISCSTVVRLSLFLLAGVYADGPLLLLALCFLPVMVLGSQVGRRLTLGMSRERFVRLITWLVLISGVALIGRYLGG